MKAFITAALLCTLTAAPASAGPAPAAAPALAKPTLTKPLVARTIERLGASAHVNACLALGNAAGTYAATRGGLLHVDGAGRARLLRLRGLGTRTHALLRVGSTLWVGGERGLARLQLGSRDARAYALRTRAPVRTMIAVGGTLYVGTWGDGLWWLDARAARPTLRRVHAPRLARRTRARARRVGALLPLDARRLLVATDAGLFELAAKTRRLRASPLGRALPKLPIFALARRGSTVLAATLGGLYSIDARGDARLVTVADVRAFASAGRDAELFAASFGDGLLRVTRVAGLASASRFSARAVRAAPRAARYLEASGASSRALCIGGRDGLWVGRSPKALRRVDITALRSGDIAAMARVGSALYLGTFDRGLARVRSAAAGLVVEHLTLGSARQSEARINAFAVDRRGALWIGTARGLYYVSPARAAARERWPRIGGPRRFTRADGLPSDAVLALAPLPGGGVLAGTGRGAVRVALAGSGRATTLSTQPIGRKQGLAARAVWSVAAQGTALWLGTARGLYRIDARGSIARLTVASGHLADDWVTAVVVAKDGAVFAGSYNAGVSRLAPSAGAKHGLAATQLGGGWINLAGLRIDGGYLYAATMAGLRRIALAPGASAWQPLHVDIGRDVTASLRAADGRSTWVSTRRGVVRIAR